MAPHGKPSDELLSFLSQTFEHYSDAVMAIRVLEEDGQPVDYEYVYANPSACAHSGLSLGELLGQRFSHVFGFPDVNLPLYHQTVQTGTAGSKRSYVSRVQDFTSINYSKLGEDLCLLTVHFIDRSLLDAQQALAACTSAFDMVISVNLTYNCYHMISYDNFHNHTAPPQGDFNHLIQAGVSTLPPQWREPFLSAFSRESQLAAFARGQRVLSLDHQQYDDQGELHWVRTQVLRIDLEHTTDIVQVTTARLIDREKLVESHLREERQAVYDAMPGSFLRCRVEGQLPLLSWNQAFAQQLGRDPIEGERFLPLIHPQDQTWLRQTLFAQLAEQGSADFVCRMQQPDGIHWMHYIGRLLPEETTPPECFFLGYDITGERAKEQSLRLKSETLRLALSRTNQSCLYYFPREDRFQPDEESLESGPLASFSGSLSDLLTQRVAPEHHNAVRQACAKAAAGAAHVQVDCRGVHSDRWWRTRFAVAHTDATGTAELLICFITDITEEHSHNATVLDTLNAVANSFIYIHRVHLPSGTVTAIRQTPRLDRLVGQVSKVDDALKKLMLEALPPHLKDSYLHFMDPQRVSAALGPDRITETMEFPFLLEGGRTVWMRIHLILSSMSGDQVESYVVCLRDISHEKAAETKAQQIALERNELSDAISAMFFAAFAVDLQRETYRTIKRAENCHAGLPETGPFQLLLDSHLVYLSPQDQSRSLDLLQVTSLRTSLSPQNPMVTLEVPITIGHDALWLRISMVLTRYVDGQAIRATLIMQDVTVERMAEQKKQEALTLAFQSAQQANTAKSSFLSRMSHDIRTPLNAIIGMSTLAQLHVDEPEEVRTSLEKIDRSSQHLLGLINEVLDMSHIESGNLQLAEEPFSLTELIEDLKAIIQPQAQSRGVTFQVQVEPLSQTEVIGDLHRLQQCCLNFLSNSLKYTPAGGSILVHLSQKPTAQPGRACYEFQFADTGYGMSEDFIPHIFEPFSREQDSRISSIQGSGLGMSIANHLVQMMGGSIHVWSRPNQGSRFTVTVLLRTRQTSVPLTSCLQGRLALVIDADTDRSSDLCLALEQAGLSPSWYVMPEALPKRSAWDVVLLDRDGAGENWQDCLHQLQRRLPPHTPLLLLASETTADAEQQARQLGTVLLERTRFLSQLPQTLSALLDAEAQQDRPPLELLKGLCYQDRRFLLVEDNRLNQEIARRLLSVTGAEVQCANDGQEAVNMVSASPEGTYDLVLMDIQMPVMNGYDATRAIRALDRTDVQTLPIFAMTADAFAEDVVTARSAGMDAHLSKPLDLGLLYRRLRQWLG